MRKKLIVCVFSGLILVALQPLAAQSPTPSPLVGSWQITLTPATPPNSPPIVPISGLATFTTDGSVIETDATEVVPTTTAAGTTTYGTPGHGIWQPSPAFGHLFIQFFSLVVNSDTTVSAKKSFTITVALNAAGTQMSGGYSFVVVDPTGHVITMGSGIVSGQKIPHPLLP
jgi:hypothetical protein